MHPNRVPAVSWRLPHSLQSIPRPEALLGRRGALCWRLGKRGKGFLVKPVLVGHGSGLGAQPQQQDLERPELESSETCSEEDAPVQILRLSESHKRNISSGLKRKWQDPAHREKRKRRAERRQALRKDSKNENLTLAQQRKWQDPEYRRKVVQSLKAKWQEEGFRQEMSKALKGKTSWNKGKKLGKYKQRSKGSPAGSVQEGAANTTTEKQQRSQETRERIRSARTGTKHSVVTRRKMSAAHMGLSHTQDTMKLLSEKLKGMPKSEQHKANIAAAQKNRLAARRALQAIEAAHSSSGPYFDIGRQSRYLLCSPAMSGARSFVDLKKNKRNQSRAEVLNTYKTLLREYRNLQEELSPWMNAFHEQHSRRPTLVDVEATKIQWLVDKFKDHLVLREKLLVDIPGLRKKINHAQETATNHAQSPSPQSIDNRFEATYPQGLSEKLAAAENYKRSSTGKKDSAKSDIIHSSQFHSSSPLSGRVQKAMDAALQYRKKQAHASAAVARAAGASAASSPKKRECQEGEQMSEECALQNAKVVAAEQEADAAIRALESSKHEVACLYTRNQSD